MWAPGVADVGGHPVLEAAPEAVPALYEGGVVVRCGSLQCHANLTSWAGGRVTTAASATSVATTTPVSGDREACLRWNDLLVRCHSVYCGIGRNGVPLFPIYDLSTKAGNAGTPESTMIGGCQDSHRCLGHTHGAGRNGAKHPARHLHREKVDGWAQRLCRNVLPVHDQLQRHAPRASDVFPDRQRAGPA